MYFLMLTGNQGAFGELPTAYALAVHDGDVGVPTIPEPQSYALLLAAAGRRAGPH